MNQHIENLNRRQKLLKQKLKKNTGVKKHNNYSEKFTRGTQQQIENDRRKNQGT